MMKYLFATLLVCLALYSQAQTTVWPPKTVKEVKRDTTQKTYPEIVVAPQYIGAAPKAHQAWFTGFNEDRYIPSVWISEAPPQGTVPVMMFSAFVWDSVQVFSLGEEMVYHNLWSDMRIILVESPVEQGDTTLMISYVFASITLPGLASEEFFHFSEVDQIWMEDGVIGYQFFYPPLRAFIVVEVDLMTGRGYLHYNQGRTVHISYSGKIKPTLHKSLRE